MIIECFHCRRDVTFPASFVGTTVHCPYCQGELEIGLLETGKSPETPKKTPTPSPVADKAAEETPAGNVALSWLEDGRRIWERSCSWATALAVHVAILLFLFLIVNAPKFTDIGGTDVGLAEWPGEALTKSEDGKLEDVSITSATSGGLEVPEEVVPTPEIVDPQALEMTIAPRLGTLGAGTDAGDSGPTLSGLAAGGGQARFMGVEGAGRRFCIIADRSGSMEGAKIVYLKHEILKTVKDLKGPLQFSVIMYNHTADPAPDGWYRGRTDLAKIEPWVQAVNAEGETNPLPAFRIAFGMNPPPDVIFFMSDGLFDPNIPIEIEALNQRARKIIIHAISFVDRSNAGLMQRIAENSGGKYRHVDRP